MKKLLLGLSLLLFASILFAAPWPVSMRSTNGEAIYPLIYTGTNVGPFHLKSTPSGSSISLQNLGLGFWGALYNNDWGYAVQLSSVYVATNQTGVGGFIGDGAGLTNLPTGAGGQFILRNAGHGTNTTIVGQLTTTNATGMTNSKVAVIDGGIHLPSALFPGSYAVPRGTNYYGGAIHWWDHGTAFPLPSEGGVSYTPGMSLKYNSDWGGAGTHINRWGKWTAPNLRIEPGYGWGYGQLMLCNEDAASAVGINWTRGPNNTEYNRANTNLWSSPLQFSAQMTDSSTNHRSVLPGIQGYAPDYNAPAQTSGARMGELWFHALMPEAATNGYLQNGEYAQHHHVNAVMLTNGWLSLGRQLSQLGTSYADDTTIALTFNGERFTRHRLSSNATFTIAGIAPENFWHTNLVHHRTIILESGATPKTLTWPDTITWANAEGNATPPASLAGSNLMEVTLRAYMDSLTTNVIATAVIASNKTLVDADLASFLQRTSITDSNAIDALQYLTYSLKQAGLWSRLDVIYPMTGGSSATHSHNLKSTSYQITWSGSLTHNANGVTGNAATGYGDTGYKFNYAGADTNAMVAAYSRTQTPTDSGRFASVTDGTSRMGLYRNGAAVGFDGPMNNTTGSGISTGTDFRGFMALSRTNSNDYFDAWRTTVTLRSASSLTTIGNNLFILARNSPPAGFHSDANLAFVCAGKGITAGQYTNLLNIVNRYQTILGRNVP